MRVLIRFQFLNIVFKSILLEKLPDISGVLCVSMYISFSNYYKIYHSLMIKIIVLLFAYQIFLLYV